MSYPLTVFKTIVNGTKSDAIDVNQATEAITAIEEFLDALTGTDPLLVDPGGTADGALWHAEASLTGPFQIMFSPDSAAVYVLGYDGIGLGTTLAGFSRAPSDGTLTAAAVPGTLPASAPGQGCMTPNGQRLYVPESGADKIHIYTASAGTLTYVGFVTTASQPVNCICDVTGENLYVACLAGTTLQRWSISGSTLTYVAAYGGTFTTTDVLVWNKLGDVLYTCRNTENNIVKFSYSAGVLTLQSNLTLASGRYAMAVSGDNLYASTNLLGGNNRIEQYAGATTGTLVLVGEYESPDGNVVDMRMLNELELFAVAGLHTVTQWRVAKTDPLEQPGAEVPGSLSRKTAITGYTLGRSPTPAPDGRHLYAVDYTTGTLTRYPIRDGRFVCHPDYATSSQPTLSEIGADDILHGTLGRMRGGTGIDGTATGGPGMFLGQPTLGADYQMMTVSGNNIQWAAHAVGAALPVATATGTYGAGEQTMLQACYDRIAAIDQALKSIGTIQI